MNKFIMMSGSDINTVPKFNFRIGACQESLSDMVPCIVDTNSDNVVKFVYIDSVIKDLCAEMNSKQSWLGYGYEHSNNYILEVIDDHVAGLQNN